MKEIDTDTLELIPNTTPIPVFTDVEAIEQSVADIVHILRNPSKNNIPTLLVGNKICNAFREIAQVLNRDEVKQISSTQQLIPNKLQSAHDPNILQKNPKSAARYTTSEGAKRGESGQILCTRSEGERTTKKFTPTCSSNRTESYKLQKELRFQ